MTNILLLILSVVLSNCVLVAESDCNNNHETESKSIPEKPVLRHITEFRKRDEIKRKDCVTKIPIKKSNSSKLPTTLGLHGLLHVRSQKTKQQTGTRRENSPDSDEAIVIKKPQQIIGMRRSEKEEKKIRKRRLRAETINMLHKIVEKYFPGGHLTVEQKIKALRILGKIIKLKKEGKTSDIKEILQSLSKKGQNDEGSKLLMSKDMKSADKKPSGHNASHDDDDGQGGGDLYATIANGPDVPDLPPAVSNKDPDHAHSNIMPVGFPHLGDGGTKSLEHQNDISDKLENDRSQYSSDQDLGTSLGQGQIYNTGDSYYDGSMGLSSMPTMDVSADYRNRMPFLSRFNNRGTYNWRGDDEDDVDDVDNDDDDDDDFDEDETGRTRSYVGRHNDDDYDDDDDDEGDYRDRFERKDKIAKHSKKTKNGSEISPKSKTRKV